ncbi:MAG: methionine--tRNA ligase [bacterium]|nr:methionine--tRNA ligase [bacterium]
MAEKFYLTTSIIYTNAAPHLGFAYELLLSDIIARYRRERGDEVFFLTGTDEHGAKIARAAKDKGMEAQAFVDENAAKVKALAKALDISNDDFIRTSDRERHWPGAVKLWEAIEKKGDLEKRKYKGLYCVGHEAFHPGSALLNGECPDYPGRKLELVEEENWFFKLSKYAPQIKKFIENGELHIIPESRKPEMLAILDEGLEDVSFSRPTGSVSWGIPVPGDPSQTMYVWCDALSNYITAAGYGTDEAKFRKWWPADLHVIGKDILRFHSLIWPGMLLSAGLELPKRIFVHGFITVEGKKMSKSVGNVIDPMALIGKYGREAFRYYFAREISPFEDGDFSEKKFIEAYNANLANGLGNLTARITKLAEEYLPGPIKEPNVSGTFPGEYAKYFDDFEINRYIDCIWEEIQILDKQINETEPFKVIKSNSEKGESLIRAQAESLYLIAHYLIPILPETSGLIKKAILSNKKPETLFPRIEK